jgi:hypothetical protein
MPETPQYEANMEKKGSTMKKIRSVLKSFDTFGIPVSLTYKNKPEIRSVIGGLFTVIAILSIAIYFCIKCAGVFNRNYTV